MLRRRAAFDAVIDCQNGIPFFSPLWVRRRTAVVQVIHHVHQDQFAQRFGPILAWVGRQLEGPVSRRVYRARPVVAVSPSTRAEVRLRLRLRGPVHVVPNGAEEPRDTAEVFRLRARDPELLFVGRLVPHKRVDLLLRALPALLRSWPRLHLSVAGDGPALTPLRLLSVRLGVESAVTFHGRIPESTRQSLLARSWLTVLPSEREGWGLTVIESNAAGVPAVGYQVPGVRDAIRPGRSGWLAAAPDQLGAVIDEALRVLESPLDAWRVSDTCRAWARSFQWRASAQRLGEILEGEVRARSHGRTGGRSQNDCVVVATITTETPTHEIRPRLRASDICQPIAGGVQLTLSGSDSIQAMAVLRRLDVQGEARVRVAAGEDLLGVTAALGDPLGSWGAAG
jgi:glycosyltransferase involved in cell wall biosynthesis